MRAGELNKRITIQQFTEAADSDGFKTATYTDVATVWAKITTTGGGEFYAAQKVNAETTALFTIRYRSGLDTRMQIFYGTRKFDILAINDVDERHRELRLSTKEVV